MDSLEHIIPFITSIGALIGTIIAVYRAFKIMPREAKVQDADATVKFASAAATAAEQLTAILTEVGKLRVSSLECQDAIHHLMIMVKVWQKGIAILLAQIIESGQQPRWKPEVPEELIKLFEKEKE